MSPVFNPDVDWSDGSDFDGQILLNEICELDQISELLGCTSLSSFFDNRIPPSDFAGDPDELSDVLGEWTDWFSIDDGLNTLNRLTENLGAHSGLFEHPDIMRDELQDLLDLLQRAHNGKRQFRFAAG